ncbi:GNAT family N-acetyltransferase [Mariniflexile jejuense]|uniref:GNAT family N-acetyltransferase n=1 Tax=Mariniflexile jejuense TaxID=1173582 RepID=A0ABW3JFQ7_9FLAO
MSLKKSHFLNELLENHKINDAYKTLHFTFNNTLCYELNTAMDFKKKTEPLTQIYIAFPNFLTPTFKNSSKNTKRIVQKYQDSFGIILPNNITNITEYLNSHFSKNSRTPIIKKMKRLEACFNISYKVFYGAIDKKTYSHIMDKTHAMLVRRFNQRNDANFVLNNWNKYEALLFPLINSGKASIFVIYNNETPIQVSINFHYKKIFFAYIPTYDIDYAQFGLGNTAVYKQLEWCIENNYQYLDMGNGDYDYKKRWCNYHYALETHIHYNPNNLKSKILAINALNTIRIKNIAKDVVNNTFYKKLKQQIFTKNNSDRLDVYANYTTNKIEKQALLKTNNLNKIDYKTVSNFEKINKPLFDFLYTTQNHIDTVTIYKDTNNTTYYIVGSINAIQVIFN